MFIVSSVLLGIGLAMDAFSVSIINGLQEPTMKGSKKLLIAFVFGFFQFAMPLIGWLCVHALLETFKKMENFIPWIAFILLLYLGGKMLLEGIQAKEEDLQQKSITFSTLMIEGIATSIDALSVGFAIAEYTLVDALISTGIIGIVTGIISYIGVFLGQKVPIKKPHRASILGGIILILIGVQILYTHLF